MGAIENIEAERVVLSGVFCHLDSYPELLEILSPEDFQDCRHQAIWRAVLAIVEHSDYRGACISTDRIYAQLVEMDQIHDPGKDAGYLVELYNRGGGAGADLLYYAQIVRAKSILRSLLGAGGQIVESARNPTGPAEEMLEQAEKKIFAIAERGTVESIHCLGELIPQRLAALDARSERAGGSLSGLDTGIEPLNELTAGLQNSELVIVAARPGVGKTAFAVHLAHHLSVNNEIPVLFFSLEQSEAELADRVMIREADVDAQRVRTGLICPDEAERLAQVGRVSGVRRLWLDDTPCLTMTRIAAKARRMKRQHGIRCVLVDYLQLIIPERGTTAQERRHEQIATITRKLKFLARELEIPVVALAQLNRASEERADRRPRLSDLRESGSVEQDADTVLLLHADGQDSEPGVTRLEIDVAKQRNGPTGMFSVLFRKARMRFHDVAYDAKGNYVYE